MTRSHTTFTITLLASVLIGTCAYAQAPTRDSYRLALKVGVESDSNALRVEGPTTTSDVLSRYFLRLESNHALGRAQSVSARFRSGGKLYREVERESSLLNQISLRYTLRPLEAVEARWLYVYASGNLKDRTEKMSNRDYLQTGVTTGLGLILGPVVLSGGVGWRSFVFKPNLDLSSRGYASELGAQYRLNDALSFNLGYSLTDKSFDVARFVDRGAGDIVQDDQPDNNREDSTELFIAGATYRGPVIAQLTGTVLNNASNTYGQGLSRAGGALTLTAPLPLDLVANARLDIQRTTYDDELYIVENDSLLQVDDDNRNTFVASLAWLMTERTSLEVKYSLYAQEFGRTTAVSEYTRWLIFGGVEVEVGSE